MDGNNFNNNNDNNVQQNNGNGQFGGPNNNYYQDNTVNTNYYQPPAGNGRDNKANGLQIAGLVCGILGICGSCCYAVPGLIFSIIGLVCSILGNRRNRNGIGIAGLACSIVGLIFSIVMSVYFAFILKIVFEMMEKGIDVSDYDEVMKYLQQYMYR